MKINTSRILAIAVLLCLVLMANAQTLEWLDLIPEERAMFTRATFIRTDAQDDVYVVSLETTTSPGGTSALAQILKFNSTGALLWVAPTPPATNPVGWFDVASDGSSFITGSGLFLNPTPPTFGFVQKYNPDGSVAWRRDFLGALMGRAVPLPDGSVRVEGSGNTTNPGIPFDNFAIIFDSNGTLISSAPLENVITSSFVLNPVAASQSNSNGEFCGVLPLLGEGSFNNQFVKLDESGAIIWSQPVSGIFFASSAEQILIDENGDCIFVGGGAFNLTVGPLSVPNGELRSNFLVLVNSTGVPQFIRVYDFVVINSIDCREPGFSLCWIGAVDLDSRPALARLDANFNIIDLFTGPSTPFTLSFKIVFTDIANLAGAFTVGVNNGTWFGESIQVLPNPNNFFTQSLVVFQLNLISSPCGRLQCPTGLRCCHLANDVEVCFRPSQYSCFTQPGKLCPYPTLPCGDACYSLQRFTCMGGQLCPVFHLRCGDACYIPSQFSCFENGLLCPVGLFACGTACYDPSRNNCCDGVICPL